MSQSVNVTMRLNATKFVSDLRKMYAAIERMVEPLKTVLPVLVVDDPALQRPTSFKAWLLQAKAIVLHEFWVAADEPSRSPGARWVWPRRARP